MEHTNCSDYIYCLHCNDNVSRSTYHRHKSLKRQRYQTSDSSSDSESDTTPKAHATATTYNVNGQLLNCYVIFKE